MGGFTNGCLTLYKGKNSYTGDRATVVINGSVYNTEEYTKALASYTKYKAQYDKLIESKEKEERLIRGEKALLSFAEKHMVSDNVTNEEKRENSTSIGVSKEEIKEATARLEKLKNPIDALERKLKIYGAQLKKYDNAGERFLNTGVDAGDNIRLQVTNERFCDYLFVISEDNVRLRTDEEAEKFNDELMRVHTRVAADFDVLFSQLVGRNQISRIDFARVYPLQMILINGKPIDVYAYEDSKVPRPVGPDGKPAPLIDLLTNKSFVEYMKAKAMAAIVSGVPEVTILKVEDAKNNYAIGKPVPIKIDVSEYKELEASWCNENITLRNFETKKEHVCAFDKRSEFIRQKYEAEAKASKKYKKTSDNKKNAFVNDYVDNAIEKDLKNLEARTAKELKKLNDGINSRRSSKVADVIKAEKEFQESIKKIKKEVGEKFWENSVRSTDPFAKILVKHVSFDLMPMDKPMEEFYEEVYSRLVSADMKYRTREQIEGIIADVSLNYLSLKGKAADALGIYGLSVVCNDIHTTGSVLFSDDAANEVKDEKSAFDKAINEKNVSNIELTKYVNSCLNVIKSVSRNLESFRNLKVGTYYTMEGVLARDAVGETDKQALLSPLSLPEAERKEFYDISERLDKCIQQSKARTIKLLNYIDVNNKFTPNDKFIEDYNLLQREFDYPAIKKDFLRISELYAIMLAKSNGLSKPNYNTDTTYRDYCVAQSRLFYSYRLVQSASQKIIAEFMNPKSPLNNYREAQKVQIAEINKKSVLDRTDEDNFILAHDIDEKFNAIVNTEMDYAKTVCNDKLVKNGTDVSKFDKFDELDVDLKRRYKLYFDEESVKRDIEERLEEEKQREAEIEAAPNNKNKELSDEEIDALVNDALAAGDEKQINENIDKKLSYGKIKKYYDNLMANYEKNLQFNERLQIADNVNTEIYKYMPGSLRSVYEKVNFDSEKRMREIRDDYYKNHAADYENFKHARQHASNEVRIAEEELDSLNMKLDVGTEIQDYWESRFKLCTDIKKLNFEIEATEQKYIKLKGEIEIHQPKTQVAVELSASLARDINDMENLMDPKFGLISRMSINDIKKLVYNRADFNPDELIEGDDANANSRKEVLSSLKNNMSFKLADELNVNTANIRFKKDKHADGGTLADYDKMTIEEFTAKYMKIRQSYGEEEARFLSDNPYMQARYESIYKMFDNVEKERANRQVAYEVIKKELDLEVTRFTNIENDFVKTGEELAELYASLDKKFYEFEQGSDEDYEPGIDKNIKINQKEFMTYVDRLIGEFGVKKEAQAKMNAESVKEISKKQVALNNLRKNLTAENSVRPAEAELDALDFLVKNYNDIYKKEVKDFIIKKLAGEKAKEKQAAEKKEEVKQSDSKKTEEVNVSKASEKADKEIKFNYEERLKKMISKYSNLDRIPDSPDANKNPNRILARQVQSNTFRSNMAAIYKIHDANFTLRDGHEAESIKILYARKELALECYNKVYDRLAVDHVFGKNAILGSKNSLITPKAVKQAIRAKLDATFARLSPNLVKLVNDSCDKNDIKGLYTKVYPTVFNYTKSFEKLAVIAKEECLGELSKKDALRTIDELEKSKNTLKKYKKIDGYQSPIALKLARLENALKACPVEDKKALLVDVLMNEPAYGKSALTVVTTACMGLAASETELMVKSVESELVKKAMADKQNVQKEQPENPTVIRK